MHWVMSAMDYCSVAFAGLIPRLVQKLQPVQNAVAWLLSGAADCEHIVNIAEASALAVNLLLSLV